MITFTTWWQAGSINGTTTTYNQYCPLDPSTGTRSLVGCVATAEAQIVYYWHYPSSISFSTADAYTSDENAPINIPGDSTKCDFPSFSTLNTDLSSITYNGNPTEEALLSFAVGIKSEMYYGSSGSAAYLSSYSMRKLGFEQTIMAIGTAISSRRSFRTLNRASPCLSPLAATPPVVTLP